jgi:hypothetical protein
MEGHHMATKQTITTSRRALLAGAAATVAIPSVVLAAADARLIELGKVYWGCHAAIDEHDKRIAPLADQYEALKPPRPEATRATVFWQITDPNLPTVTEEGRRYYAAGAIALLRNCQPMTTTWANPDSETDWTQAEVPDVQAKALAENIIAAFDKWQSELDELCRRLGYQQLCDEQEDLYDRIFEVREEITATPATTAEGRAIKARLLQYFWDDCEPESAGDKMALSIARDLLAATPSCEGA